VDGEGLLRSFNTRCEELFGVKRMALLDKPLKDLGFLEPLRLILREAGGEGSASGWLFTAKGVRFYASVRCGAARDEDGRLLNLAVFIQPGLAPAEPEPEPMAESPAAAAAASAPAEAEATPGRTSSGIVQQSIAMDVEPGRERR
jgi:hypothetical protein